MNPPNPSPPAVTQADLSSVIQQAAPGGGRIDIGKPRDRRVNNSGVCLYRTVLASKRTQQLKNRLLRLAAWGGPWRDTKGNPVFSAASRKISSQTSARVLSEPPVSASVLSKGVKKGTSLLGHPGASSPALRSCLWWDVISSRALRLGGGAGK